MTLLRLINTALAVALYLWAFWYLYIIVMGLYRAHLAGRLTRIGCVLAAPALVLAWVVDWVANWTIALVVFAEAPDTPFELVTGRLSRYTAPTYPGGFQKRRAWWICTNLLDYFDPTGQHCAPPITTITTGDTTHA